MQGGTAPCMLLGCVHKLLAQSRKQTAPPRDDLLLRRAARLAPLDHPQRHLGRLALHPRPHRRHQTRSASFSFLLPSPLVLCWPRLSSSHASAHLCLSSGRHIVLAVLDIQDQLKALEPFPKKNNLPDAVAAVSGSSANAKSPPTPLRAFTNWLPANLGAVEFANVQGTGADAIAINARRFCASCFLPAP